MSEAERLKLPLSEQRLWPAKESGLYINGAVVGCHVCHWSATETDSVKQGNLFISHDHATIYDVEYRLYKLAPRHHNMSPHYVNDMLWLWDRVDERNKRKRWRS